MIHHASPGFWGLYHQLPADVRAIADRAFSFLRADPKHPSLHFKRVGKFWSARVGLHHRAVASRGARWHALVLDRNTCRLRPLGWSCELTLPHVILEITMKSILILSAALLTSLTTWAADDIKPFDGKPGLWETTSTTEMSGMPSTPAVPQIPPEQLAKMTPQQRAQVEAMIKSRMGAASGAPQSNTSKVCLTSDSFKNALAMNQNRENCTNKLTASSSSSQTIHMECTQGKTNMTGDMTVERLDAEHAKGNMVMKASGEAAINIKTSFSTKWLSPDCGDVKPLTPK